VSVSIRRGSKLVYVRPAVGGTPIVVDKALWLHAAQRVPSGVMGKPFVAVLAAYKKLGGKVFQR
jgi:hypothetical protein